MSIAYPFRQEAELMLGMFCRGDASLAFNCSSVLPLLS